MRTDWNGAAHFLLYLLVFLVSGLVMVVLLLPAWLVGRYVDGLSGDEATEFVAGVALVPLWKAWALIEFGDSDGGGG